MNLMTSQSMRNRNTGATMVEVLVSVLLLSFSLLGIAGLMAATTRYQLGVESRSTVTMLFNDATSRMRTNLAEVPGFDATVTSPTFNYTASWSTQQSTIASPATNCGPTATATCTNAQRATYDLWELRSSARRSLPQGSLQLIGDTADGLTVTYLWMDKDFVDGSLVSTSNPSGLRTSATCSSTDTIMQRQACCPTQASVSTSPGVRCLNFTFIP